MAKLRIDEGELLEAFDSGDGMMQWYLDRHSGEVIGLSDFDDLDFEDEDYEDEEEGEEGGSQGGEEGSKQGPVGGGGWQDEERALRRKIFADVNDEHYLQIPSLESHEGYRIMEDFAAGQDDDRVRERLFRALDGRRPFRAFKDALFDFPDARERWFAYHERRLREEALAWLEGEGIDAELTSPAAQPE